MTENTENKNLELWNAYNQPPDWALRTIKSGRLKGKSDINPIFRYKALTERFGPCGLGWKYTIDNKWTDPGPDSQVFVNIEISLFVKFDGEWSEPIKAIGGSMLIKQEQRGPHANDEGYKMALTDALSVGCKMLGIAADVYAGLFDGSKHSNGELRQKPDKLETVTESNLSEIYNSANSYQDLKAAGEDQKNKEMVSALSEHTKNRLRKTYVNRMNELNERDIEACFSILDSTQNGERQAYWKSMQEALKKMSTSVQQKVTEHYNALLPPVNRNP